MHSALYVSKTGLSAQDTALTTISNNLANVGTVGFKRDTAVFQDLLYQVKREPGAASSQDSQLPSGLQLGTGVRVAGTAKQFTQGAMQVTERPLDMAVTGRGMFQVLMPDGTTGYTRNGQFQVNSNGEVVTANGYPLQPGITVPSNASIVTIGSDGVVSARIAGEENSVTQLGQIDLADFVNPQGLKAIGNNLFRETEASGNPVLGTPGLAGLGNVSQGTLETSNVDVVEEMVNMITTQRAYEMNSKVVSSADQMLQFITQNL
jgi:flagellar basal-body rod protein FlgG